MIHAIYSGQAFAAAWWFMRSPIHCPVCSWKSVPPLDCVLPVLSFIPPHGEKSGGDGLPPLITAVLPHSPSLCLTQASTGEPLPEMRIWAVSFSCLLCPSPVAEEVAGVGTPAQAVGQGSLPIPGGKGLVFSGVDWGWRALRVSPVLQLILGANVLPTEAAFTPQTCRFPLPLGKYWGAAFLFVSRITVFLFF